MGNPFNALRSKGKNWGWDSEQISCSGGRPRAGPWRMDVFWECILGGGSNRSKIAEARKQKANSGYRKGANWLRVLVEGEEG